MARRKLAKPEHGSAEKMLPLNTLRPHPRNYRNHPEDQIEHLQASLSAYGFFRRIVVANDGTILAGHGIAQAANTLAQDVFERVVVDGMVPVIQFPFGPDDPRALKLVAIDNEIGRFAEVDERALTDLLQEISEELDGLVGTGFDESMLAALAFATRTAEEFSTLDAANEWAGAGMPEYGDWNGPIRLLVLFRNNEDRDELVERLTEGADKSKILLRRGKSQSWTTWYPPKLKNDAVGVAFEEDEDE